jgi:xanthine dehydrogenase molybdenum-binding subunit
MRGPGDPQVYFAVESHTDYIARELKMDPLEFRRINVLGSGGILPSGHEVDTNCGKELLDRIRQKTRRAVIERGRNRFGKGLALALRDIGPGEANVEVGVNCDGRAYLLTTVTDTGAGAHTTLRQIVAETLGTPNQNVDLIVGNTDSFSTDIALGGSRVNYMAGRAAALAAFNLQYRMKKIMAQRWRCDLESIRTSRGILLGPQKNRISFSDLAREVTESGQALREIGHFVAKDRLVEVDVETGRLTILRMTSVNDVGTIINPLVHQAQIEGGLIQGLGYAVMEHLQDNDGKIVTTNLGDYKIPAMSTFPVWKRSTFMIPPDRGLFKVSRSAKTQVLPRQQPSRMPFTMPPEFRSEIFRLRPRKYFSL